jgi:hypothetical protein
MCSIANREKWVRLPSQPGWGPKVRGSGTRVRTKSDLGRKEGKGEKRWKEKNEETGCKPKIETKSVGCTMEKPM